GGRGADGGGGEEGVSRSHHVHGRGAGRRPAHPPVTMRYRTLAPLAALLAAAGCTAPPAAAPAPAIDPLAASTAAIAQAAHRAVGVPPGAAVTGSAPAAAPAPATGASDGMAYVDDARAALAHLDARRAAALAD